MAKGEVVLDIKQLEAFRDRIKDLDAEREAFMVSTVKNLAARLLRKVILRTPTDTGQLKNSWTVEKVIKARKYNNYQKVGRNGPCPCGSGKKFKKCCLK